LAIHVTTPLGEQPERLCVRKWRGKISIERGKENAALVPTHCQYSAYNVHYRFSVLAVNIGMQPDRLLQWSIFESGAWVLEENRCDAWARKSSLVTYKQTCGVSQHLLFMVWLTSRKWNQKLILIN